LSAGSIYPEARSSSFPGFQNLCASPGPKTTVSPGPAVHRRARPPAGRATHTLFVDDLDKVVADIASRGIETDDRETYTGKARKAIYRDADGNEIGFAGAA
jgi:hypothetical protein